jgi:preprotein translocase subunit SecA
LKKFFEIFQKKRSEKIKLIGVNQYSDLEKKIFLQVLDFSWRTHLQYLEQLRQVIGLRSYGQKDPLSEFKKEAFTLFETLLEKIKVDVIKFLLNMNLVLKDETDQKKQPLEAHEKIGRNDKCPCGSGKKYKHCCGSV